jgi:hypothetical protein
VRAELAVTDADPVLGGQIGSHSPRVVALDREADDADPIRAVVPDLEHLDSRQAFQAGDEAVGQCGLVLFEGSGRQ